MKETNEELITEDTNRRHERIRMRPKKCRACGHQQFYKTIAICPVCDGRGL